MTDRASKEEHPVYEYEAAFEEVQKQLRERLLNSPSIMQKYASQLLLSQGKLIRSRCLLIASMNKQNRINTDAIKLACAIELIHLASLVHDDVIDNAPLRRGSETIQKKFGKKEAVMCGDWLLCLALNIAAQIKARNNLVNKTFINYAEKICLGEMSQLEHNKDYTLSFYRYVSIIKNKTAALFEAAFFFGATLSDALEKEIASFAQFGHYLGICFQLIDDCIDYETAEHVAGKPVKSDFTQGTITLPLIYTLDKDAQLKKTIAKSDIFCVIDAVQKAGGITFTKKIAALYEEKAKKSLNKCTVTAEKKELMLSILSKIK